MKLPRHYQALPELPPMRLTLSPYVPPLGWPVSLGMQMDRQPYLAVAIDRELILETQPVEPGNRRLRRRSKAERRRR